MAEKRVWHRFELKRRSRGLKKHARKAEGATIRHARRFVVNRWENIREVRAHIILWLTGLAVLIALVGLQMLWFQRAYVTTAPTNGGTYAEAVVGPINTLNPLYATTPAEVSASKLLFSSLYSYDETGHLKGDIASSMKSSDTKTYTVTLRKDAKWHNGQPLTAEDVVFTVDLMKNTAVRSVMNASWRGVTTKQIDKYTVEFSLPAAYAAFPQALTFAVLPKHLLKDVQPASLRESSFSKSPVGSGPFTLRLLQTVNIASGRKVVHLAATEQHYDGRPRLERFQLHVYGDGEAVGQALKTGEVNAASDVPLDMAASISKDRYDLVDKDINSGVYVIFNAVNPALKDPVVRRALQLGTNTQEIRDQFAIKPRKLDLPFIGSQVPGSETLEAAQYSIDEANKALTDGGWEMKDGVRMKGEQRLELRVVTRKSGEYEKVLALLVKQWGRLGVDVQQQVIDANDAAQNFTQDILQRRNYDVLLDQLVIGGDPDVFAYWHSLGILNFANYSNQTSDDALASARTQPNQELRAVKYLAFAKQWLQDAPAIGLYQSNMMYVRNKASRSIEPTENIVSANEHYANVRFWTAEQGTVYKTP